MKYLKSFLPKETLLDTTVLLISFSLINAFSVGEIFVFGYQFHQIL